jgi:acyl carrier protein
VNNLPLIVSLINALRDNKGLPPYPSITASTDLRKDLGLDSLDLAELTVRLEKETGVDVFAEGIVTTVGEVLARIGG